MLRIQQTSDASGTTLHLEGKLLAAWTSELRIAASSALAHGSVRMNLAALTFADADGVATLRSLQRAGIQFIHVSPFMDKLLAITGHME
jgi:ABC-type transporter Mla MlaB component